MTCNTYIAWGMKDDAMVMKVGKTIDIQKREDEIGICISEWTEFDTERESYSLETKIRKHARSLGAVPFQGAIDWFEFDETIYLAMSQVLYDTNQVICFSRIANDDLRHEAEWSLRETAKIRIELIGLYAQIQILQDILLGEFGSNRPAT